MPTTKKNADEITPSAGDADKRKVTFYLPTAQARALKVYAAQHDLDMSAVISELLSKAGIG